jgi:hypothetical protein
LEFLLSLDVGEGISKKPWSQIDKSKLPKSAFLWIEGDGKLKSQWHLPYKDENGDINLGALRAISAAIAGARTGKPMSIPADVKTKIDNLLKQYKIGQYATKAKASFSDAFKNKVGQLATDDKGRYIGHVLHTRDVTDQWSDAMAEVTETGIDSDNKIIKGVCVFGRRESDNGYTYLDKAITTLTKLVEGVKVFINHPSKSETKDRDGVRDLRDWAGIYTSPRREGDKIFADLNARESYWDLLEDIALMKPAKVGNSINSRVKIYVDQTGKESVVDIDKLHSVDLVASGATIDNLWESTDDSLNLEEQQLNEQVAKVIEEFFPKLLENIKEGILSDRIKQDDVQRQADRLLWKANDMIYNILRDKELKSFRDRRDQINSILDDLESELGKILPKIKPETEQITIRIPTVVIPD